MSSDMCKETERLVRILGQSDNPTDIALIILANKIDMLDGKIDKLDQSTEFARWIGRNKSTITTIGVVFLVFALFGFRGLVEYLKKKVGL